MSLKEQRATTLDNRNILLVFGAAELHKVALWLTRPLSCGV